MAAVPSPSPDDHIQIGSVLDNRYRIDAVIGIGGMGRVYRAEHTALGRTVAIKVLHADLGRNKEAVTRFQREALASGRLDHANIVGVSDFGVLDDGACFLVMEALEGEPLGQRLERDKTIAWGEALTILRGILAGLRHAHDRGVVHRDIKPDNIFLALKDGEPIVKILDFGIAKLYAGSVDDPATTRAGLTVGTPAYLSPEQAVGGEITPGSDLYSSTVVLYEMLTGRTPFESKDPLAMLTAHVSKVPPRLSEVAPFELPKGLDDLVAWGLQKMPIDRVASAADYLKVVDEILGITPRVPSSPIIVPPSQPNPVAVPAEAKSGKVSPFAETSEHRITPPPVQAIVTPAPGKSLTPVPHPLLAPITIAQLPVAKSARDDDRTIPSRAETSPLVDHDRTTTYAPPPVTPAPSRTMPIAPGGPIARKWLYIAIAALVIAGLAAIGVALTSRAHEPPSVPPSDEPKVDDQPKKDEPPPPPGPKKDEPKKPKPHAEAAPPPPEAPREVTIPPPEPPAAEVDPVRDAAFKKAMSSFVDGKRCHDRKVGFDALVQIDDTRVVPAVKKWGHRWHSKYLGLSEDDYNDCMSRDVDQFLKSAAVTSSPSP